MRPPSQPARGFLALSGAERNPLSRCSTAPVPVAAPTAAPMAREPKGVCTDNCFGVRTKGRPRMWMTRCRKRRSPTRSEHFTRTVEPDLPTRPRSPSGAPDLPRRYTRAGGARPRKRVRTKKGKNRSRAISKSAATGVRESRTRAPELAARERRGLRTHQRRFRRRKRYHREKSRNDPTSSAPRRRTSGVVTSIIMRRLRGESDTPRARGSRPRARHAPLGRRQT